jgi:hypothetical protein
MVAPTPEHLRRQITGKMVAALWPLTIAVMAKTGAFADMDVGAETARLVTEVGFHLLADRIIPDSRGPADSAGRPSASSKALSQFVEGALGKSAVEVYVSFNEEHPDLKGEPKAAVARLLSDLIHGLHGVLTDAQPGLSTADLATMLCAEGTDALGQRGFAATLHRYLMYFAPPQPHTMVTRFIEKLCRDWPDQFARCFDKTVSENLSAEAAIHRAEIVRLRGQVETLADEMRLLRVELRILIEVQERLVSQVEEMQRRQNNSPRSLDGLTLAYQI